MAAPKILFVHQNFPGQFGFIVQALLDRGDQVAAIGSHMAKDFPGVDLRRWSTSRRSAPGISPAAGKVEAEFIHAEAAAFAAMALKSQGFVPDVIVAHPGWGETLFLNEIFPNARQILFGEIFYRTEGQDLFFDREFDEEAFDEKMGAVAKNITATLAYTFADRIMVPTPFQAAGFPDMYAPIMRVHHEGVDLTRARRQAGVTLTLPDGRILDGSKPVITFVNRSFERVRGFHIFMRALPKLMAANPDVEIVLIGRDENKNMYGAPPPGGGTWREYMLAEVGDRVDQTRMHFMGVVQHPQLIEALSISWAHVYYSYPFVLSWSLVEAMACECLIVASDTAALRDAVTNGETGILNDFFDVEALSDAMIRAVREPETFLAMRRAARECVFARFDREKVGVPGWLQEIDALLAAA